MNPVAELPELRQRAAALVLKLPPPVRRLTWATRRAASRVDRQWRERRGDWSRSRPALHDIDVKLEKLFGGQVGYFVEAGAFDGFNQSNTYYLEKALGWRGTLIEPVTFLAWEARRERPSSTVVNCALVPFDYSDTAMTLRYGGTMTLPASDPAAEEWVAKGMVLDEPEHEFTVPALALSDVLDTVNAPAIDLLSLDVEGYEAQVLAGLDLERHAPRWIVVEVDMRAPRTLVEAVLGDRYRAAEQLSPNDVLYERISA